MPQQPQTKCEVCAVPATMGLRDFTELPDMNGWACSEAQSTVHYFCDDHNRPSLVYRLDGRVGYWRDVDSDHQEWQDWNGGADAVQQAE